MSDLIQKLLDTISGFFTPADFKAVGESVLYIIFIIIGAFIVLRTADIAVTRFLQARRKLLPFSEQRAKTVEALLRSLFRYTIYFVAGVMILTKLGINPASLITTAGILGLAVGFGAQNLVRDVITGFFILFEDQFAVGDYIKTAGASGIIEEMGLRSTKMRDWGGELHIVPNGQISQVTNYSRGQMRALVDIAVSYEEDVDKVLDLLSRVAAGMAGDFPVIVSGPDVLGVIEFRERDFLIRVQAQTAPMEQWTVERELRRRIKQEFERTGMKMSYQSSLWWTENMQKKEVPEVES